LVAGSVFVDEGVVQSTTAEGGGGAADSISTLYSTTARANMAVRLIARLKSNQVTAGTWAAVPTIASLPPFNKIIPHVFATDTSGQTINDSTATIVDFGTVASDNFNSVTTGSSWKFVVPIAGIYDISSSIQFSSSATNPENRIYKNGSQLIVNQLTTGGLRQCHAISIALSLAKGDEINLRAFHSSGGSRTLETSAGFNYISISYKGPN
jgi:hypothetical protein